ncbi:GNAT family N-acetyltransferase [Colwelliaceae bacterium BS250]
MNINIRKAQLNDLDKLLEFEQGVIASERPFDKSLKDSEISYYNLEKLITSANSQLVVAEYQGELIASGYALLKKSEPFEKHDYFSYLGFMFVAPKYRRKGINKQIIDSLIDWSKSKGIVEVRLDVFEHNQSAVIAYNKLGFSKTLVQMRMDVI